MEYDVPSNEALSVAVVKAVCKSENCQPTSLPPLYDVLDPDALDTLFRPLNGRENGLFGSVSFVFNNSRVTVNHGEYITVEPVTASSVQKSIER